jgi:hypothetical protein
MTGVVQSAQRGLRAGRAERHGPENKKSAPWGTPFEKLAANVKTAFALKI